MRRKSFQRLFFPIIVTTVSLIVYTHIFNSVGSKPYYLVDKPKYVFINNDAERPPLRPANCNPLKPKPWSNVTVRLDGFDYPRVKPLHQQHERYDFACLNSSRSWPIILAWNFFGGVPLRSIRNGPLQSTNCPVTNCLVTNDRQLLNRSTYVLFHMRAHIDEFPPVRFSRQKWVYVILESPQNCAMCTKLDGLFNLSVTYRY